MISGLRVIGIWLVSLVAIAACGQDPVKTVFQQKAAATPDAASVAAESCTSSKDCAVAGLVCDKLAAKCVDCNADGDCAAGKRCSLHACIAIVACKSDKACIAVNGLCDTAAGVCVDCLAETDCSGGLTCQHEHCAPPPLACASSKECVGTSQVCDKALGLCADCVGDEDCATGTVCDGGGCVKSACTPGQATCVGLDEVATCDAKGTHLSKMACEPGDVCEGGACKPVVCKPGETTCDGLVVTACSARGASWNPIEPCPAGQLCVGGVCKPVQCKAGESACQGAAVATCQPDGTSWASKPCPSEESCSAADGSPHCIDWICQASTGSCAGHVATACSADGLTITPVDDCDKPGADGKARACLDGKCVPAACAPGKVVCDGGELTTCKADGLGWTKQACPNGLVCDGGGCVPIICVPGEQGCSKDGVQACSATGTTWLPTLACKSGQACVLAQGKATCKVQVCTAGTTTCGPSGFTVLTCGVDGTATIEQPCVAGSACSVGVCVPQTCKPMALSCENNVVMQCGATGLSTSVNQNCVAQGKACVAGACLAVACGDGAKNQVGEQCDDGNTKDGDGCSAGCQTEAVCNPACSGGWVCLGGQCGVPCTASGGCAQGEGGAAFSAPGAGSSGIQVEGSKLVMGSAVAANKMTNLWASNSPENTVSKVDTKSAKEVGRYKLVFGGVACTDPSRTAVDWNGDAWIGCRGGGKVTKIASDPKNCIDKNGNGKIDTAADLNGDGAIAAGEMVNEDECILWQTPVIGGMTRAVGVDKANNAWVGFWNDKYLKYIDGKNGTVLQTVNLPCAPYGLIVAPNGVVWAQGSGCGLVAYDPVSKAINKYNPPWSYSSYGISVDAKGRIWLGGSNSGSGAASYDPKNGQWVSCQGVPTSSGIAIAIDGFVYPALDCKGGIGKVDGDKCWATKGASGSYMGVNATGGCPHGVAIDFDGLVWGVNWTGNSVAKADPKNWGAAPIIRPIGSSPYTYSDMTGYTLQFLAPGKAVWVGTFFASEALNPFAFPKVAATWKSIAVAGAWPAGSSLTVRVRSGNDAGMLANQPWVDGPAALSAPGTFSLTNVALADGALLQVELSFIAAPGGTGPAISAVSATWAKP